LNARRAIRPLLLALAAGLAANSLLGPVAADLIEYAIPRDGVIESQLIGLDLFSLVIVAPLAVVLAARREHPLVPVVSLGIGVYAAYMLAQYILGPEPLAYPGNSDAFFPFHLAILVIAGLLAIVSWSAIDLARLPFGRTERLVIGTVIPVLALVTFIRYIPGVLANIGDEPSADYLEAPTFFWTIALLDLGFGLPAVIAGAYGARRGHEGTRRVGLAAAGWFALVGPAVGAMAIAMRVNDVPDSSTGLAIAMTLLGVVFAGCAIAVYRSMNPKATP
jgi:hypothetical protein